MKKKDVSEFAQEAWLPKIVLVWTAFIVFKYWQGLIFYYNNFRFFWLCFVSFLLNLSHFSNMSQVYPSSYHQDSKKDKELTSFSFRTFSQTLASVVGSSFKTGLKYMKKDLKSVKRKTFCHTFLSSKNAYLYNTPHTLNKFLLKLKHACYKI